MSLLRLIRFSNITKSSLYNGHVGVTTSWAYLNTVPCHKCVTLFDVNGIESNKTRL